MQTSSLINHFYNQPYYIYNILQEFSKNIHLNTYFRNMDYLISYSKFIKFDKQKWIQKPHHYCKDYYGDTDQYLYPIILLVNGIGSFFDFMPSNFINNNIITPSKESILTIYSLDNI